MIRIGANPIGWSNDDLPELGGEITLEQCLREAKAAGMQGMELGNKFPRRAGELKPILDRFGLALVGGWWSTFLLDREPQAEMQAAADHIALLKTLGAKVFIAAECTRTVHGDRSKPLSARPVMTDAESHRLNARLSEFAERLIDAGLILVYHHHMGTVVQTGAEIERLMDGTGHAVNLLLDTGHATWAGADPAALARKYRMRIGHVHTKDVRRAQMEKAAAEDLSFLDAVIAGVYTVPGDGIVDFPAVLRELPDYSGWIVVEAEQYLGDHSPAEYAKLGHDNLVGYLAEAGLRR
jgi:inosose dehydratase